MINDFLSIKLHFTILQKLVLQTSKLNNTTKEQKLLHSAYLCLMGEYKRQWVVRKRLYSTLKTQCQA